MKTILFSIFILFVTSCASQFEKEKLAFEKDKLTFDKEKLAFEKQKFDCERRNFKCPCTSNCNTETKTAPCTSCGTTVIIEKKKPDCERINPPADTEIRKLAQNGGWHYSPEQIKNGICKGDPKEAFYKLFSNTESYVAETQVPATKKSSCINNVLFSGKAVLYKLMEERTEENKLSSSERARVDKGEILRDIVSYNKEAKGRSFYYECYPSDSARAWNSCSCILYASYRNGEDGLAQRMKQ